MDYIVQGEVFRRVERQQQQIDHDNDNNNNNNFDLTVTIAGRQVIITSPTLYYSRGIPDAGFDFLDIFSMSTRLNVRGSWLAAQLNREENGGVAGAFVAQLANGANQNYNMHDAMTSQIARMLHGNNSATPELNVVEATTIPEDQVCVLCLDTAAESPQKNWATCAGCDIHRFHFECISRWRGSRCMVCRAELE
jgi:hypothetical protein